MSHGALIGISACLIAVAGMVIDPLAGMACAVIGAAVAIAPAVRGKGKARYIAVAVLLAALLMVAARAPEAVRHYERYRAGTAETSR